METLTIVRRKNGRFARKSPSLKFEIKGNRFILSEKAQANTKLKHDEGVMFGFNYSQKKAYIFKDDEPDAFILRTKSVNDKGLRFTSKDLGEHFINCFNLTEDKTNYFFEVAEKPNNKGAFLLTYK